MYQSAAWKKQLHAPQTTRIHHWWRGIYNLGISFRTKLNSRASIMTLKQMLFPRNKSQRLGNISLNSNQKDDNTYLITPIKQKNTLTNWGCFIKTMIGKMAYS
jgi:hypothetical protein